MTEEYSYDYARWLEDSLINILTNGKGLLNDKIIKKLKVKGIKCHDEFVKRLDKINNRHKIIEKLPLLSTYPIDLSSDIYEEDIEKINEWEIETVSKLYKKLREQYGDEIITPNLYYNFFNREIAPYKEYLLSETYEKTLPENITKYWCYRVDKTISWDKCNRLNKVGIDIVSVLESQYLKIYKTMEDYDHLLNQTDC